MPAYHPRRCAILAVRGTLLFAGLLLLAPSIAMAQHGYAQKPVPNGLGAVIKNDPSQPLDVKPFTNPYISYVALQIHWSDIEPAKGKFNWERLDQFFDTAQKSEKYVHLYVYCGFFAPTWAIQGATYKNFVVPYGPYAGKPMPLPTPYDPVYLGNWFAFLKQLSQRYGDRPEFLMIGADGPTSTSDQANEPDKPMAEIEMWILEGYTSTKFLEAWNLTFKTFKEYFPNQYISLASGSGVPINAEGAYDPNEGMRIQQELPDEAFNILGDQLTFQAAGLRGNNKNEQADDQVIGWIGRSVTGFQFDTTCIQNPAGMGAEGNPQEAMILTILNGMRQNDGRHVDYIEIYGNDVEAEQLQPVLRWAASLFQD
jgi:Beta-galactosidase